VHVYLGHGSFAEYVERVFGYKPRTTHEKLRVAEALERLPELARALDAGDIGWCALRELTRVVVPQTQRAWLDAARGKTVRQLEQLVATKSPGDTPEAPPTHRPCSRLLRFEVAPDTFAAFREALRELQRSAGGGLDDDALLLAMARHVLAGPRDDGRASYQVSLSVCAACGRGSQLAGTEAVPVGADLVAMAACDAQHIGHLLPRAANENGTAQTVATAPTDPAHVGATERPGEICAEGSVVAKSEDNASGASAPVGVVTRARAKQSIPPAVRRAVLARDQRRCRVPGCAHATFLDVHHVRPRSEGGSNDPENLVTLCSAHHRAAHRGQLSIEPAADGSPAFRHADGARYGNAVAPAVVEARAKVFAALRQLGFREGEVRAVLAGLLAKQELRDATAECLLREALCRIRRA
jgi:hypothetical protein